MGQLGMGVMINMLGGNEDTVKAFQSRVGKTIESIQLADNTLKFLFDDGTKLNLRDDGQSCCESRYMTCDDDLTVYTGATLDGAEIADAPDTSSTCEDGYGEHEVQFLKVKTSKGVFTVETHNEHNGYYGGFWIVASV